jgi:hypothetical protein
VANVIPEWENLSAEAQLLFTVIGLGLSGNKGLKYLRIGALQLLLQMSSVDLHRNLESLRERNLITIRESGDGVMIGLGETFQEFDFKLLIQKTIDATVKSIAENPR